MVHGVFLCKLRIVCTLRLFLHLRHVIFQLGVTGGVVCDAHLDLDDSDLVFDLPYVRLRVSLLHFLKHVLE